MLYLKKTFSYEYETKEADVCLVGIPYDSSETGKSVKYGPVFLREAIKNLVGFDPELGINVFERLKFTDLGDVEVVPGKWVITEERIKDTLKWIFAQNSNVFPVFLGGEHLITLGVLRSLAEIINRRITVIDFDAHRDLMPEYMGERFSHLTWAYHILKNPRFQLVQIGCRSWSREEDEVLKKNKVRETLDDIENPVYLTIDMDVFDPSHAPEVGTPEAMGLGPKEFFELLKKIPRKTLIGMDIVECSADRVNTQTAVLGAQIFKKVLGHRLG